MKRAALERYIVVVLFIAVIVVFTMAERDTKKQHRLYNSAAIKTAKNLTAKLNNSDSSVQQ